jgi:hypothetical protein
MHQHLVVIQTNPQHWGCVTDRNCTATTSAAASTQITI